MIQLPGSWHPKISPDGLVAFGNGFTSVLDPRSRQVTDTGGVRGPSGIGSMWPCGWHMGQLCVSEQTAGGRRLVNGPIVVPEDQAPGWFPARAVAGGHVVSSARGQHFIDGRIAQYAPVVPLDVIEDFDGRHYIHKEQAGDPWPLCIRDINTQLVRRIARPLQNSRVFTDPQGAPWVFANETGLAVVFAPDGGVTPLLAGESRGALTWHNGELIVWTVGIDADGPFCVGRPLTGLHSSTPAIIVRGIWFVGIEIEVTANGYLIAGCHGEHGLLTVDSVAFDSPRRPFSRAVAAEPELPAIAVPDRPRALYRGCFDGISGVPGNFGAGKDTSRPIVEGVWNFTDGSPWLPPENENRLVGVFLSPHEPPDKDKWEEAKQRAVGLAKRTQACVLVYADRPAFDLFDRVTDIERAGAECLPCIRAYPVGPADTVAEFRTRLDDDLARCRANNRQRIAICRPLYTQTGHWPTLLIAECNQAVTDFVEAHQEVVLDIAFGWKRRLEPPAAAQWCEDYWTSLCDKTPVPSRQILPMTGAAPVAPERPAARQTSALPTHPPAGTPPQPQAPQAPGQTQRGGWRWSVKFEGPRKPPGGG
jgi:hypothetical protein